MIGKLLAAMLVLAACAGCGVRASNVIPGAQGPVVDTSGAPLYLVRNGKLTFVLRPSSDGNIGTALAALANGVEPDEAAQGFTSEVPRSVAPIRISESDGQTTLSLAVSPSTLSTMAVRQITCTAQSAVRLAGGGVTTDLLRCPVK